MLASLRPTCKPGRRKHKHKHKERKLINSDKLSAYILAMLESNLAPKGSPAARLCQIFMLLRLRMSPCAYAYRTRTHPCAYAYACVVRVNQALGFHCSHHCFLPLVLSHTPPVCRPSYSGSDDEQSCLWIKRATIIIHDKSVWQFYLQ